jgi:hypothetical protein
MRIIYSTVVNTISALVNVGSLMFLIIYIYSVIGISLFASVKLPEPSQRSNFLNISNAFMSLIKIATGEGWDLFLGQLDRSENSIKFSCI